MPRTSKLILRMYSQLKVILNNDPINDPTLHYRMPREDIYLFYIFFHLALHLFLLNAHIVTCLSLSRHVTPRHCACVTDTRTAPAQSCDRVLHVTAVKCLIASLTKTMGVFFAVWRLFAKKFGRPSGSADLKSISLVTPSAKTHSFFHADDVKLLKPVIKYCPSTLFAKQINAICKCFHTSELVWEADCGSFSHCWPSRVYMLRRRFVSFCALTSSGFCQPPAATRFSSCDAKETSGFFQCVQRTGEVSLFMSAEEHNL